MIARCLDLLDLRGRDGRMSFAKNVILTVLVSSIATGTLSDLRAIALIAAAFGRSLYMAFLNRSSFAATSRSETLSVEEERVVTARAPDTGEPT